jgi:hypothetical protein
MPRRLVHKRGQIPPLQFWRSFQQAKATKRLRQMIIASSSSPMPAHETCHIERKAQRFRERGQKMRLHVIFALVAAIVGVSAAAGADELYSVLSGATRSLSE